MATYGLSLLLSALCQGAVLGPDEIRAYQVYLTTERRLAPSSLVIAVSALRFLYKVTLKQPWSFDDVIPTPKKPRTLPIVLSPDEVVRFLECVTSLQHRTILTTCYAAGLRISEAVRLHSMRRRWQRQALVDSSTGAPFDPPVV